MRALSSLIFDIADRIECFPFIESRSILKISSFGKISLKTFPVFRCQLPIESFVNFHNFDKVKDSFLFFRNDDSSRPQSFDDRSNSLGIYRKSQFVYIPHTITLDRNLADLQTPKLVFRSSESYLCFELQIALVLLLSKAAMYQLLCKFLAGFRRPRVKK